MKKQFLQKIFSYIEEQGLIRDGDVVIAGVSGGADSMCLLEVLLAYREKVEFSLQVIHVEHGIRGEESVKDAAYVQQFCEERRIPCEVTHVDACAFGREKGLSVEEAARELRYEAFEAAAREAEEIQTADVPNAERARIAVAHHMEDQAETVLWQLIRGSAMKGMGGMRPERERIIRPLLRVNRTQIEAFLRESGIGWREDATNGDRTYTRNRLRLDVLPVLTQLNEQAVGHICESADTLQEAEEYLEAQTDILYERYTQPGAQREIIIRADLLQEPPFMRRRVLYRVLWTVCGSAKDLGSRHVALLEELFSHQVGRVMMFPYQAVATRVYEGVCLSVPCEEESGADVDTIPADQICMRVLEWDRIGEISKKKYTKWFDYDKIKYNAQIRKRQSGDYLVIDGAGHRQKLKSYLVNEKIPQAQRDELLLLADGSHVMWVIGYRISDYYKVDEHTKRVLEVRYDGGKEDE